MKGISSLTDHEVLTVDEVADFLRVARESLESEIKSGRLLVIKIGDETRLLKKDLLEFLELAKRGNVMPQSAEGTADTSNSGAWFNLELEQGAPFSHRWPSGKQEEYGEAYFGTVHLGNSTRAVQIGFTERQSAGRIRKRSVVFIEKRPLVEFVGSDGFDQSGTMVSLLKHPTGKHVKPAERTPPQYKHMRIEPYNSHVTGPYASSSLAIVCTRDELSTMVEHALLRLKANEARR